MAENGKKSMKEYTLEEVSRLAEQGHAKLIVVNGNVYDVANFLDKVRHGRKGDWDRVDNTKEIIGSHPARLDDL